MMDLLKENGHKPQTEWVLKEMSMEDMETSLCFHSEKIALAYKLLVATPNETINIYKNLRICGDCHEAIKQLSKLLERNISVRDMKLWHHFKEGQCSCKDKY